MVRAFTLAGAVAWSVGCAAGVSASALRAPLEARCVAAGLSGCPVLAEGVAQYVERDRNAASRSLQLAADVNDAAKIRAFVASEKATIASHPTEASLEMSSALGVLQNLTSSAAAAGPPGAASSSTEPVAVPMPKNARKGTVLATSSGGVPCKRKPGAGPCMQRRAVLGPITITDIESPGGCPDELLVFVGEAFDPEWIVSSTTRLAVHNGSYPVVDSLGLWVASAAKPGTQLSTSDACMVTWRGTRPTN